MYTDSYSWLLVSDQTSGSCNGRTYHSPSSFPQQKDPVRPSGSYPVPFLFYEAPLVLMRKYNGGLPACRYRSSNTGHLLYADFHLYEAHTLLCLFLISLPFSSPRILIRESGKWIFFPTGKSVCNLEYNYKPKPLQYPILRHFPYSFICVYVRKILLNFLR